MILVVGSNKGCSEKTTLATNLVVALTATSAGLPDRCQPTGICHVLELYATALQHRRLAR